ncbi:hypothetical protein XA68_16089 [Ophiocordyceps unilateralis]|uniref:Small-subunit processome Utp12 domain-containing protein n=1 Tax=Ophiocordyceps unilateralis TaxID=268505 RepID=A0A2A9PKG8_OPHUN|nr:hypothetical protein XA68_16089 [Ophiocordyceps unilateralis]
MSAKRKAPVKLAAPVAKSATSTRRHTTIDESRTSVSGTTNALHSSPAEPIEISSDEDGDEEISDVDDAEEPQKTSGDAVQPKIAQSATTAELEAAPAQVNGNPAAEEPEAEPTSPSFGELLRGSETIDVTAFAQQADQTDNGVTRHAPATIVPPSHKSLITVLSQALRTDDNDLLESCLHTKDAVTIQNTIERIDSSLAGILLTKLAARMHRRPGRAGALTNWMLWILVAHGGALASQPQVLQGLNSLQKVLADRTKGLNSLMALDGKLDLLDGQINLRQRMKRGLSSIRHVGDDDEDDDDNEEDVIWVEGGAAGSSGSTRRIRNANDDEAAGNGIVFGSDGDSHDSDSDDSQAEVYGAEDFIVNEAVEDELVNDIWDVDEDSHMNYDDVEEDDDDSGDKNDGETVAPPSKAPKVSKSSRPRKS